MHSALLHQTTASSSLPRVRCWPSVIPRTGWQHLVRSKRVEPNQNSSQERNKTQPGAGAWTAGAVSMQPQINAFPGTTGSISMAHHSHHPHYHGHPFQTLAFIQNPSLSWALARWPTSHWRYREPTGGVFLHLETLRQSQNQFRPLRISGTCEK